MDCFSDASLEPPAIAVYNPDVLGVYLVLYTPYGGQPGMSLFLCSLSLCLRARSVSPM